MEATLLRKLRQLQAELDLSRRTQARAHASWILEREHLRRLLDQARDERDAAREALCLWEASDFGAAETIERMLARERRALAALARVEAERDHALEIAHDLAIAARRGDVAGELVDRVLVLVAANDD